MRRTLLWIAMLLGAGLLAHAPAYTVAEGNGLRDHLGAWEQAGPHQAGPRPQDGPPMTPAACECIYGPGGVRVCGCAGDYENSCVPGGVPCRP